MATVERIEARVALLPLLGGEVVVTRLAIVEPVILLETASNGAKNWEFAAGAAQAAASEDSGTAPFPALEDVAIEKARVSLRDGRSGKTTTVVLDRLVGTTGADSRLLVEADGTWSGERYEVKATLGALAALADTTRRWPVELEARVAGAVLTARGEIARPLEGKGAEITISAEGKDVAALAPLAGAALPSMGPYAVSGRVADAENGTWRIDDLRLTLGSTNVTGRATVAVAGKVPALTAELRSPLIDLVALGITAPPKEGAAATPAAPAAPADGRVFDATPLPLGALKSLDAEVTVAADRVVSAQLVATNASLGLSLKGGRLELKPFKAGFAGGTVDARLALDAAPETPTLAVFATAKNLDAGALLADLGVAGVTARNSNIEADLRGSGGSVREIMAGLDGRLGLMTGEGSIGTRYVDAIGADLVRLMLPGGEKSETTKLNCVVAQFAVVKGMAKSEALLFDTSRVTVRGEGTVDLRDEKLDLLFTPRPKEASLVSLATPVRLTGTLANPDPGLDSASVAKGVAGAVVGTAFAPIGLLLPLVSGGAGDDNPCVAALKQGAGQAPAAAPAAEGTGPAGVIDGIERGIRNLFGR
jgi:hypothetical protein